MSVYRIRRGDAVREVDGFATLVEMARDGSLQPDDAVFVPASNRWHEARSIRQLREHFPQELAHEEPPRPPSKISEIPKAPPREERGPEEAVPEDGGGPEGGASVVRLRRGRWTPDGKGVEVPVFDYDVDLGAPVPKPIRLVVAACIGLLVGGLIVSYHRGHQEYLAKAAARMDAAQTASPSLEETPVAASSPEGTAVVRASVPPGATPAPSHVAVARPPTPVPLPLFDPHAALRKVMEAPVTAASRPDLLAAALRGDLVRLAVPVREVTVVATGKRAKGSVPFDIGVDYSVSSEVSSAARARHYWMIVAMVGRRANELKLNMRTLTVRTFETDRKSSEVPLPAALVKGVPDGTTALSAVLEPFPEF